MKNTTTGFPEIAAEANETGEYQIGSVSSGTFEVGVHDANGNRIALETASVRGGEITILNFVIPTQTSAEGVLQGKVAIVPLCPIEPCNLTPEQIAGVYEARKAIIYEQLTEMKIAGVSLNASGEYSFSLTPGSYIVDITDTAGNALPLPPAMRPTLGNAIPTEFTTKAGETVFVDFDIDTGIR